MEKTLKRNRSKDKEEHYKKKIKKLINKMEKLKDRSPTIDSDLNMPLEEENQQDLPDNITQANQCVDLENNENKGLAGSTEQEVQDLTTDGEFRNLNEKELQALGIKTKRTDNKLKLQPDLNNLINEWLKNDHRKDLEDSILQKYPCSIENCLIEAPKLNLEISASTSESVIRRNKYFEKNQNISGSAIVAISTVINNVLNEEEKVDKFDLLEKLSDSLKMIAQLHYNFSLSRKAYITPTLNKECKTTLENSKPDEYLYGENLPEKIKAAKAINKVGEELKIKTK